MKLRYFLFLLMTGCLSLQVDAQERYLDAVFDDVDVTQNVVYGNNYTVLTVTQTGTTARQPLIMDVYTPAGDTVTNRPLVVYLHTGNFLPIQINGSVTGSLRDSSTVEICKRLASMGYVVASADYRLGWNPFAESVSERTLGLINAAYRGVQDARTCIRHFRRNFVEDGNTYGIDTSKIVVWGQGTGGYIALAAATLDQYTEIVTTTMPAGKFTTDLDGDGNPDPMVIEAFNGDIYGTSLGLSPGGAVPAGDTLCEPNHVGYSSDFDLCVNLGGALGDISWLEADEMPVICFQVPTEENAPYNSRILSVPSPVGALPVVEVQGSQVITQTANDLGLNDIFAGMDDALTQRAMEASAVAGHDYYEGLYPLNQATNMFGRVDGSPWVWWDAEFWGGIEHPTAGTGAVPEGASYDDVSRFSSPTASAERGRAYIDTIIGYYAPRAYLALGLDSVTTSVPSLNKGDVGLNVSPNPSPEIVRIQTNTDYPMRTVRVIDLSGRTVAQFDRVNNSYFEFYHLDLPRGMYVMEVTFDEGRITERLVFD